jgi:hypothetical protein
MEYTSHFKEKASKQMEYKIKLEKIELDGKLTPASSYTGKFAIKMTSVEPNYDYSVYNMETEPSVKTSEKYFGGEKSCYFSCEEAEVFTNKDGEEIWKYENPEALTIEMQRHAFNTPNLPAIFGLGGLAGSPKGLNAVVWETV